MITTISDGFLSARDIPPADPDYQWAVDGIRQCSVEYLHMIADAIQPLRAIEMYPSWDNDKKVQEILDSQRTLSSCTLVCHSWNEIFQVHLYRTIYINSDKQSASLARSLRKLRPQNARYVRNLTLDCTKSANIWTFVFRIYSLLQDLHNLTIVAINLSITHHFFPRMLFKLPATCKIYFPGIRAKSPSRILRFLKALPPIAQYSPSCPLQPGKLDDLLKSALRTISQFAARSTTFDDWEICIEEARSAITDNRSVEKEFIAYLAIAYIIYGQLLAPDKGTNRLDYTIQLLWDGGQVCLASLLRVKSSILMFLEDWHAEVATFKNQFPEPLAQLDPLPPDDIARWEIWQLRDVTKEVSSTAPISGDAPLYSTGFNMIPILLMSDEIKKNMIDKLQEHITCFSGPPEDWRELNRRLCYLLWMTTYFPKTLFVSLDSDSEKDSHGSAVAITQMKPRSKLRNLLDLPIVLKGLSEDFVEFGSHISDIQDKNIFFRRAVVWQQLKHSFILPFIGIALDYLRSPQRMIVPRILVKNGTIKEHIKRLGHVPTARSKRWLKETALGIDYLHRLSLVHGDICSATIFIDNLDHVKISDVGLCDPFFDFWGWKSRPNPYFTPPERLWGYTVRSRMEGDIFSFGCFCVEVYCINLNHIQIYKLVTDQTYPKPPEIPDQIWDLVKSCCKKEPELRPSITSVIERLDSLTDV